MRVRRTITIIGLLLVIAGDSHFTKAWGETKRVDTVYYTDHSRTREAKGEVKDFDSRGLQLLLPGGQTRIIDGENVLRIDTYRTAAQRAARLASREGQYAKAASIYFRLLQTGDENRAWVQQEIQYELVLALTADGKYDLAAREFLKLWAKNPPASYRAAMPLVWTGGFSPSPRARETAQQWLQSSIAAEQLLGASLLLGSRKTQEAQQVLQQLSQTQTDPIAPLAAVQALRVRIPMGSEDDIQTCRQALERIDPPLRGGPYYILGRLYTTNGDYQRAALAAMHIPILYHDPRLAAESLLTAGKAMVKSGQPEDGTRIYKELITTYPQSAAAAEAKQGMKQ